MAVRASAPPHANFSAQCQAASCWKNCCPARVEWKAEMREKRLAGSDRGAKWPWTARSVNSTEYMYSRDLFRWGHLNSGFITFCLFFLPLFVPSDSRIYPLPPFFFFSSIGGYIFSLKFGGNRSSRREQTKECDEWVCKYGGYNIRFAFCTTTPDSAYVGIRDQNGKIDTRVSGKKWPSVAPLCSNKSKLNISLLLCRRKVRRFYL